MYYRVTTYGVDPARREEAFGLADTKREELKGIAGLQCIHVCDTDDAGGVMMKAAASALSPDDLRNVVAYIAKDLTVTPPLQKVAPPKH